MRTTLYLGNAHWQHRMEGYRCPLQLFFWAHSYKTIRFLRRSHNIGEE